MQRNHLKSASLSFALSVCFAKLRIRIHIRIHLGFVYVYMLRVVSAFWLRSTRSASLDGWERNLRSTHYITEKLNLIVFDEGSEAIKCNPRNADTADFGPADNVT